MPSAVLLPSFNDLLDRAELNPQTVRLVRHSEASRGPRAQAALRSAALAVPGTEAFARFERYQAHQGVPCFHTATHVAGFIGATTGETLFIGVWAVAHPEHLTVQHALMPELGHFPGWQYNTIRLAEFEHLHGRLVIEWGPGTRAWRQWAGRRDKPITRLTDSSELPFPGWANFRLILSDIADQPATWRAIMEASRGVYLLVHQKTGQQYIGVATVSFWHRWLAYADGHGGNVEMKKLAEKADQYDVSVLEVASSMQGEGDLLARESWWKQTLKGSLNAN